nr:hypothetical protein HmN_000546800 [Hymenolepis microstoma]
MKQEMVNCALNLTKETFVAPALQETVVQKETVLAANEVTELSYHQSLPRVMTTPSLPTMLPTDCSQSRSASSPQGKRSRFGGDSVGKTRKRRKCKCAISVMTYSITSGSQGP